LARFNRHHVCGSIAVIAREEGYVVRCSFFYGFDGGGWGAENGGRGGEERDEEGG
jgi:hypothetical protein